MPAVVKRGNYDTPAEWGQLKQKTRDGHNKTYEREFSDGAKLVTFVEMAEPEDQPKKEKKEKKQQDPHGHGSDVPLFDRKVIYEQLPKISTKI